MPQQVRCNLRVGRGQQARGGEDVAAIDRHLGLARSERARPAPLRGARAGSPPRRSPWAKTPPVPITRRTSRRSGPVADQGRRLAASAGREQHRPAVPRERVRRAPDREQPVELDLAPAPPGTQPGAAGAALGGAGQPPPPRPRRSRQPARRPPRARRGHRPAGRDRPRPCAASAAPAAAAPRSRAWPARARGRSGRRWSRRRRRRRSCRRPLRDRESPRASSRTPRSTASGVGILHHAGEFRARAQPLAADHVLEEDARDRLPGAESISSLPSAGITLAATSVSMPAGASVSATVLGDLGVAGDDHVGVESVRGEARARSPAPAPPGRRRCRRRRARSPARRRSSALELGRARAVRRAPARPGRRRSAPPGARPRR